MNNEFEIRQCWVEGETSNKILYRYFLTESNKVINYNDFLVNVKAYGVRIISQIFDGNSFNTIYEDYIDCVANDKEKVTKLIDYLANNEVSPYHIVELVGNYADEWVDDFDILLKEKFKEYAIA